MAHRHQFRDAVTEQASRGQTCRDEICFGPLGAVSAEVLVSGIQNFAHRRRYRIAARQNEYRDANNRGTFVSNFWVYQNALRRIASHFIACRIASLTAQNSPTCRDEFKGTIMSTRSMRMACIFSRRLCQRYSPIFLLINGPLR